jgi:hypothetical protein
MFVCWLILFMKMIWVALRRKSWRKSLLDKKRADLHFGDDIRFWEKSERTWAWKSLFGGLELILNGGRISEESEMSTSFPNIQGSVGCLSNFSFLTRMKNVLLFFDIFNNLIVWDIYFFSFIFGLYLNMIWTKIEIKGEKDNTIFFDILVFWLRETKRHIFGSFNNIYKK